MKKYAKQMFLLLVGMFFFEVKGYLGFEYVINKMKDGLDQCFEEFNKKSSKPSCLLLDYALKHIIIDSKERYEPLKKDLLAKKENQQIFIDSVIEPMLKLIKLKALYNDNLKEIYDGLQDPALDKMWSPYRSLFEKAHYVSFDDLNKAYKAAKNDQERLAFIKNLNKLDYALIDKEVANDKQHVKVLFESLITDVLKDPKNWLPVIKQFMQQLPSDDFKKGVYIPSIISFSQFNFVMYLENNSTYLNPFGEFDIIGDAYGDIQALQLALLYAAQRLVDDHVIQDIAPYWKDQVDPSLKNHAFTASDYIAATFGLNKEQKYTTLDLLNNSTLKLDRFKKDFGIVDMKEVEAVVTVFGSALDKIK